MSYFREKFISSDINSWAIARSVISEMHSGFQTIRSSMPFSLNSGLSFIDSNQLRLEIKRVEEIWLDLRNKFANNGKYLFGEFGMLMQCLRQWFYVSKLTVINQKMRLSQNIAIQF